MKVCPNCQYEFDDLEENCPKCNAPDSSDRPEADIEWLVLTTVSNEIEYEMTAGVLSLGNIPVTKSVKGIDGFVQIILGVPIAGIDVLVPSDRFEEAKELLEASIPNDEFLDEPAE